MTIYLYVKTHNKTGLKYLGKTSSTNPHRYLGSGTYWRNHLRKHGYDHTTEILVECQTNEEVKQWGLYYSNLWDILNARDENGKRIWANLKLESGDGGALSAVWNKGKSIGYCWTDGVRYVIQVECPGEGWVKGSPMKGRSYPNKTSEAKSRSGHKGVPWWNNGVECKRSKTQPGPEWKRGFINPNPKTTEGKRCWNNGVVNRYSAECPGEGWKHGPIRSNKPNHSKETFWWNNGVECKRSKTQPGPEWVRGLLKSKPSI